MDIENKDWYNKLNKSFFTPPNYIFGIVWPILYTLMFISIYKILHIKECKSLCNAKIYFIIQLSLNLIWTYIFFKKQKIFYALIDLILIIIFTILTINEFDKYDKQASNLLIPYIIWLFFALYLNLYIYINN